MCPVAGYLRLKDRWDCYQIMVKAPLSGGLLAGNLGSQEKLAPPAESAVWQGTQRLEHHIAGVRFSIRALLLGLG